jgi:hypothetical protein
VVSLVFQLCLRKASWWGRKEGESRGPRKFSGGSVSVDFGIAMRERTGVRKQGIGKRLGWRSGSYDWYLMAARGTEMLLALSLGFKF